MFSADDDDDSHFGHESGPAASIVDSQEIPAKSCAVRSLAACNHCDGPIDENESGPDETDGGGCESCQGSDEQSDVTLSDGYELI